MAKGKNGKGPQESKGDGGAFRDAGAKRAPKAAPTTPKAAPSPAPSAAPAPSRTPGPSSPAPTSASDDLARLLLTPVEVARRVLPERRLPFYLGVGALAAVGVLEWPLVLAAGLGWEALRRRPTS